MMLQSVWEGGMGGVEGQQTDAIIMKGRPGKLLNQSLSRMPLLDVWGGVKVY